MYYGLYSENIQLNFENSELVQFTYYPKSNKAIGLGSKGDYYVIQPQTEGIIAYPPPIEVKSGEIKSIFSELNILPFADAQIGVGQILCQHFKSFMITNCQLKLQQLQGGILEISGDLALQLFEALDLSGVTSQTSSEGLMKYLAIQGLSCDLAEGGICTIKYFR
ncbi:MAG: hypothetical protein EOP48_16180 [Sphingobacteriales bacterium]|nr:MAG: hypothetical protein EOP48_16180 [Sphingobacteriales bacterium]